MSLLVIVCVTGPCTDEAGGGLTGASGGFTGACGGLTGACGDVVPLGIGPTLDGPLAIDVFVVAAPPSSPDGPLSVAPGLSSVLVVPTKRCSLLHDTKFWAVEFEA